MKVVYLAGPYRGNVKTNIARARKVAIYLWEEGLAPICPHLNTAHFEDDSSIPVEAYLNGDMEILSRCDAIIMIPGWRESPGALAEKKYAEELHIPVYIFPHYPNPE